MASYVDVETSAEAIQEDEELIEAVEAIVEIAAVSVKSEILRDINSFLEQVQSTVESLFPLLVDYRIDPSLLWQDIEHLCIFLVLASVAFLILAPRQSQHKQNGNGGGFSGGGPESKRYRRRSQAALTLDRSRTDSNGSAGDAEMDSANNSLNSQSSWFPLLNEESDEERFRRIYPMLYDECKYFKLLLPPECQLVEDSLATKLRHQQQKQRAEAAKQKQKEENAKNQNSTTHRERTYIDDADDPAQRLQFYFRQFMVLVRSLFTFDYVSAAWTILLWLQGIRKHRRTNSDSSLQSPRESGQDIVATDSLHESITQSNNTDVANGDCGFSLEADEHVEGAQWGDKLLTKDKRNENENENENADQAAFNRTSLQHPDDDDDLNAHTAHESEPENIENLKPDDAEGKGGSKPPAAEHSTNSKGLDGLVVETVSFLHDHLNNFVRHTMSHDSPRAEPSEKQDSATADNTTVEKDDSEAEADNITSPERTQNQSLANEETATISSTESKLRSTPWYFFESANSEESLKRMSLDVPVPDKNGYILGDEYLPDDRCTPVLVFVNSRSGPQQGQLLITQLKRLLNPIQVWDLAHDRPEPILESFCALTKLRILVCGGDGTVSWIISALDSLNLKRKWPPIAILPLGTGNDLARVHGWGAGYNNESLISILEQISESYISVLDRWELTVEDGKKRITKKNFFNYFSFGIDAELALQVHYLRERRPEWFFSRFVNKAWYGIFGAEESIKGKSLNVRRDIAIYADGVHIPLPADSQGVIILNIDSYAGGVPLWSHAVKEGLIRRSQSMGNTGRGARTTFERIDSSDDLPVRLSKEEMFAKVTACDRPSSCQDGYLDVVSVRGLIHLGQIKVGIGRAQRLCQCREIKIVVKKKVAVQIDGEPWRQDKCVLRIKRKRDPALMLHRSTDDGGIETEMSKLLEWAEERNLIDGHVHSVLMKEFSRRIESKARQRRYRSKEHNVIENLKRAIGSTGTISSLATGGNVTRSYSVNAVTSQKHFYHQYSMQAPYSFGQYGLHNDVEEEEDTRQAILRRPSSRSNLIWGNNSFSGTNCGIAF